MADVLFTMSSTTGAEALAMEVPVIHLQSARDLDLSPFFEVPDAAFQVSNAEEFQCALDLVLNRSQALAERQRKWGELVTQTFYAVDGRAGERFVEILSREVSSDRNSAAPTHDLEVFQQASGAAG
jgi:hypothetical protein